MTEEQDEGRDAMLSARLEQAQCWVGSRHTSAKPGPALDKSLRALPCDER